MSRKVAAEAGDTEFARFTQIAMASASELKYYLILARDLELLSAEHHRNLTDQVDEVQKMLTSLIRKLRTKTR
jgi:four helix bundle protein